MLKVSGSFVHFQLSISCSAPYPLRNNKSAISSLAFLCKPLQVTHLHLPLGLGRQSPAEGVK